MESYIIHYGTKNSGRYPRGSGENPHQHDGMRPHKRRIKGSIQKHTNKQYRGKYKNLSDEQLDTMIQRLQKEKQLQSLYGDLNLHSKKNDKNNVIKEIGKTVRKHIINSVSKGMGGYIEDSIRNRAAIQKQSTMDKMQYVQAKRLKNLNKKPQPKEQPKEQPKQNQTKKEN